MNTKPIICMPSDLLRGLKHIDEAFSSEAEFFKSNNFDIAIIDLENKKMFYAGTIRSFEQDFAGRTVLYRGWMLNEEGYHLMQSMIEQRHGVMYTSVDKYQKAHYLPNWIETFQNETAETKIYPLPINAEMISHDVPEWQGYFIKDYVKSYYGQRKAHSREELHEVCQNLVDNENLQKGLVVRKESVSLIHGTKEIRCWWTPKGWFIAQHPQHQEQKNKQKVSLAYLSSLNTLLLSLGVKFVSVDLYWDIELEQWKLIEIGDGQVSGLGNVEDLEVIFQLL